MQVEGMPVERPSVTRLKRFTAVAAVVVMVWIALGMLHQLGLFLLVAGQGPFANAGWSPFGALEAFVLGAVVSVAVLWARPRQAAALVLAAVVIAAVGVLLQLGSLIISTMNLLTALSESGFAFLEVLRITLNLVLPVLALVWLLVLRGTITDDTRRPAQPQLTGPAPAWQPEQARGAHWSTAAGAASGSAASDWGTPGQPGGWGPPAPDSAPQTPARPSAPAYYQPPGQQPPTAPQPPYAPQPMGPEQFGPQAIAEQYGRPPSDDDRTRAVPTRRREPPQWTPLDGDPRK